MKTRLEPPRLARWILQRALPADVRDDVCGDLDEVFQRDCAAAGARAAASRYRRKVGSFSRHFLAERVRDRWQHLRAARVSTLDFRLGVRMLRRYPGLTIVGGLAMAFAIAVGTAVFALLNQFFHPTIPLPEGDRIVVVRLQDSAKNGFEYHAAFDFARWRAQLTTISDLTAFRDLERNLITSDGLGEPVRLAETTASVFRMTKVAPLHGRTLIAADEQPGAPPVVIVGYKTWLSRFHGDTTVIGQTVRLGNEITTLVGVMPEGFLFPVQHDAWTPLRLSQPPDGPRQGPAIRVSGRLAPGATIDQAQNELSALGARTSADFPATHARLRPEVQPFANSATNLSALERAALWSVNVFVAMLLVLVSGNVALLMFARAATREAEIVVRGALGASRGRIVAQFFAEALVLGGAAAVVGLLIASWGLRWGMRTFQIAALGDNQRLPFWISDQLAPSTILYAIGLTLLACLITGVIPALKVTRGLQSRLRESTAGGGGLKFGGIWTLVIVSQVAVTVAFPVTSFLVRRDEMQIRAVELALPAEQFLSARLEKDGDDGLAAATRLRERLAAEPGLVSVTLAQRFPRMYHPYRLVEVDDGGAAPMNPQYPGYRVSASAIDAQYFASMNVDLIAGRAFTGADFLSKRPVVIVNQQFAEGVFAGRNPIGRRIRHIDMEEWSDPDGMRTAAQPWLEIVGVAPDLGMGIEHDGTVGGFYQPLVDVETGPVYIAMQVKGEPIDFAPRLRGLAAAVDPSLRLYEIRTLDRVTDADLKALSFWFRLTVGVSVVALILSLAGIYSVMAFTVSRRTREIGIRVALGSDPSRVVLTILRRPLRQVALGILAGAALTAWLVVNVYEGSLAPMHVALVAAYALFMMAVCLLACVVPTLRALRVQPTEALRT